MFVTLTAVPAWVKLPFQPWVTVCPPVNVQPSLHAVSGSPLFTIVMFAVNPVSQSLVVYCTVHATAACADTAGVRPVTTTASASAPATGPGPARCLNEVRMADELLPAARSW